MSAGPEISYLGWSGFQISIISETTILIDPPAGTPLPKTHDVIVLITHGHPDHVAGIVSWLQDATLDAEMTIVASAPLIQYFRNLHVAAGIKFRTASSGVQLNFGGHISVRTIEWTHMQHIPPEPGNALSHIAGFLRHPFRSARIALDALRGPPKGPLLGFCIIEDFKSHILFYSEGLHRQAHLADVRANILALAPDVILLAVELEDVALLPHMLKESCIENVVIYEAHAPWRAQFGIGNVNLESLCATLRESGIQAECARVIETEMTK